jgi:hypothetical protein
MATSRNRETASTRREYLPHIAATLLTTITVMIALILGSAFGLISLEASRVATTLAWLTLSGLGIASYAASRQRKRRSHFGQGGPAISQTLQRKGVHESP